MNNETDKPQSKWVILSVGAVMAFIAFFVSGFSFYEAAIEYANPSLGGRDWLGIIIYTTFGVVFLYAGLGTIKTTARWFRRSRPQHEPTN